MDVFGSKIFFVSLCVRSYRPTDCSDSLHFYLQMLFLKESRSSDVTSGLLFCFCQVCYSGKSEQEGFSRTSLVSLELTSFKMKTLYKNGHCDSLLKAHGGQPLLLIFLFLNHWMSLKG